MKLSVFYNEILKMISEFYREAKVKNIEWV